jgi:hypothetical protein
MPPGEAAEDVVIVVQCQSQLLQVFWHFMRAASRADCGREQ